MGTRRPDRHRPKLTAISLTIPSNSYLVSPRVGNYQFSLTSPFGVPVDQLWVR